MNWISAWPVRAKLLSMVLIPMLALLVAFGVIVVGNYDRMTENQHIQILVALAQEQGLLAHELQKERGMSAGFLSSKGAAFKDALPRQHQEADRMLAQWQQLIARTDVGNYPKLAEVLASIRSDLGQLATTRSGVMALGIPPAEAIGFYTGLIDRLLLVAAVTSEYTHDGEVSRSLQAYYNLLQAKERAGIERAVLSAAFAADGFANGLYNRFMRIDTEQAAYFQSFQRFATVDGVRQLQDFMASGENREVERLRKLAHDKSASGGFAINPESWFSASTARLELLKKLESHLEENLMALVGQSLQKSWQYFWFSLTAALVVLLLTVALTQVIYSLLYRQIKALHAGITRISDQLDLSVRVPVLMADELGDASKAFNQLVHKLEETVASIADCSTELHLIAIQNHMTISLSTRSMQAQQDETASAATAVTELEQATQEIASSILHVADKADQANKTVEVSGAAVDKSLEFIGSLNVQMDQAAGVIQDLNRSSGAISGVLEVIRNIAEQTNLLALNAAIEAARAGEQGRGFAVVADEVRSLASKTQDSTAEISRIVGQFQQDSQRAFGSVQQSQSVAQQTVELSATVAQELDHIREAIRSIRDMTDQVASAAEEQVATNKELTRNMTSIHRLSESTTATGGFMRKTGVQQRELAEKLMAQANRFRLTDRKPLVMP